MRSATLFFLLVLSLGAGCSNKPAAAPAASATAASAATHLGVWYWIGTTTAAQAVVAVAPERFRIDFAETGTLRVQADCNRGSGSYKLMAGALALGPIGLTKMGCAVDSQDREFLSQLAIARSLTLVSDRMYLELDEGRGRMHFARDPKSGLLK
jgi:heat shock protein HslJ